jgi:hypothetical protein
MTQQGKQMKVKACEGFVYNSIKLVVLANSNRYGVVPTEKYYIELFFCGLFPIRFFMVVRPFIQLK